MTNENLKQWLESKLRPGTPYTEQDLTAFALGVEWAQDEAAKRHAATLEYLLKNITDRRDGYLRDAKRFAAAGNYATASNLFAHYEAHGMVCFDIHLALMPNAGIQGSARSDDPAGM